MLNCFFQSFLFFSSVSFLHTSLWLMGVHHVMNWKCWDSLNMRQYVIWVFEIYGKGCKCLSFVSCVLENTSMRLGFVWTWMNSFSVDELALSLSFTREICWPMKLSGIRMSGGNYSTHRWMRSRQEYCISQPLRFRYSYAGFSGFSRFAWTGGESSSPLGDETPNSTNCFNILNWLQFRNRSLRDV